MPAGRNTKARREREASFQSCPYTPTAVHLYPNGFVPIANLKRIFFLFIRLASLFLRLHVGDFAHTRKRNISLT